jgi:hypothetical protein
LRQINSQAKTSVIPMQVRCLGCGPATVNSTAADA